MIRINHWILLIMAVCVGCARKSEPPTAPKNDPPKKAIMLSGKDFENWQGIAQDHRAYRGERGEDGVYTLSWGRWTSPQFVVEPQSFYRFTHETRSHSGAYATARCFNEAGVEMDADNYTGIDPSADWLANDLYFMARPLSRHATVNLETTVGDLQIRNVSVWNATRNDVRRWMDRLYTTLPPVDFTPPADRWKHLSRTRRKLRDGKEVRVLLLGDSIANDFCNSHFQLLVERQYPGATIHLTPSVRGSTGARYYRRESRVQAYVIDHAPDLVVFMNLGYSDIPSILDVMKQVRVSIDPDFLAMTGAISLPDSRLAALNLHDARNYFEKAAHLRATTLRQAAYFCKRMQTVANTERIAIFNSRQVWEEYLAGCGKPNEWYLRDGIHANERGKQILARIAEILFTDGET